MLPTKFLFGQVLVVLAITIGGVWTATQLAASDLGYQAGLGAPWSTFLGTPVYLPWRIFEWWFAFDAYAPAVFNRAGLVAAGSGFGGCAIALAGSLHRARQNERATTYGSSR